MTETQPSQPRPGIAADTPPAGLAPPAMPPHIPTQRQAGGYPHPTAIQEAPIALSAPAPQSTFARHLGAIVLAAVVLVVGAGAIAAFVFTRPSTTAPQTAATAPSATAVGAGSYSSDTTSSGASSSDTTTALTSADQMYVSALRSNGVAVPAEATGMISVGHWVCTEIEGGQLPRTVGFRITTQTSMTPHQAGVIVGGSVISYCPQYRYQLDN